MTQDINKIINGIDGIMLDKQREDLRNVIIVYDAVTKDKESQVDSLRGIENLLDEIADYLYYKEN